MDHVFSFLARVAALVCVVAASGVAYAADGTNGTVDRMYVLECGESKTNDVSANWSPGVNVGMAWEFSDNCYLIQHGKNLLLWDSGMSDSIAAKAEGVSGAGGLLTMWVRKTLASQLQALGIAPTDITDIAFSHFHGDHVGNANLFTSATLYIQEPEYDAAFGPNAAKFNFMPPLYEKLRANPTVKLNGDHDVFGDGSVVILSTPGHTPGHQCLLVRLPKRGASGAIRRHGALPGQLDAPTRACAQLQPGAKRAVDGAHRRAARGRASAAVDQPRQGAERDHPEGPGGAALASVEF